MSNLFKRYEETSEQIVLLLHEGNLSFDLIQLFIDQIESSMEKESFSLASKKKVYNVLVEVFQNLNNYIDQADVPNVEDVYKTASLKVWIENGVCNIATGNYIENTKVEKLYNWLEEISVLDSDELRKLYKEILNNDMRTSKGGGGLGFLDIARKTGTKMEYNFEKTNDVFSYFNFETKINLENI